MLLKARFLPVGALAAAATLFSAGAAHAAPATPLGGCSVQQVNQAFLPWGDPSEYFLAPDGNFAANSTASWSLTGGASVVAGGDGYSLGGAPASTQSLSLPDGSSATSPSFCVTPNDPSARFFAENSGSSNSTLQVNATVNTGLVSLTVTVANLSAGSSWSPTAIIPLLDNIVGVVPGAANNVTLSFVPQGQGGNWQIDDLYLDPYHCC